MKKLAYIGCVGCANSATAIHVQNRARLIHKLGIMTYAISTYPGEGNKIANIPELIYCYMPDYKGSKKIRGLQWNLDQFISLFSYRKIVEQLQALCPDIIVLYEVNSIMLELALRQYCKKNNIKIVIETTEWMGKEKNSDICARLLVLQKHLQKKYIDKKCNNIIAISHYLEKHYRSQNCNVVRIPPLFSHLDDNFLVKRYKDDRCDASVKLVFAGTLAQKDFLEPMLKALVQVNCDLVRISFDIVGPSISEIEYLLARKDLESVGIFCHGRLPHEEVLQYVQKADFSILLRQNMRYAKAGVSTKFVEAMCMGVPSICTKVGGSDLFVQHGENGFLIDANSENEIIEILEHVLKMDNEEILTMKKKAHEYAKENFSVDMYIEKLREFLMNCM